MRGDGEWPYTRSQGRDVALGVLDALEVAESRILELEADKERLELNVGRLNKICIALDELPLAKRAVEAKLWLNAKRDAEAGS